MNETVRDRAVMPLVIPVGALLAIAIVTLIVSRVLLAVHHQVAVAIALMLAVNVLVVCAFLAIRSEVTITEAGPMAMAAAVPLVAGIAIAAGILPVEEPKEEGHKVAAVEVTISAESIQFNLKELKVPAETEFKLVFTNKEAAPHNVVIQKDESSTEFIFREEYFAGPKTVTWNVPPIDAGSYFFKCEVHPAMNGTLVAERVEEPSGARSGAAGPKVEVSSKGLEFSTKVLDVPAGQEFDLALDNQETIPHNLSIYEQDGGNPLFVEDPFSGPRKVTWRVPALPAGEFFFKCDVHPTMKGTVKAA